MRRHRRDGRERHVRTIRRERHACARRLQTQFIWPAVQYCGLDTGGLERRVDLVGPEGEGVGGCHAWGLRDADVLSGGGGDGESWAALGRGVGQRDAEAVSALDFGGLGG